MVERGSVLFDDATMQRMRRIMRELWYAFHAGLVFHYGPVNHAAALEMLEQTRVGVRKSIPETLKELEADFRAILGA